jgi:hypothetical protein
MKREGNHGAFNEATKAPHHEKKLSGTSVADTRYGKNNLDNEKEMAESVNKLSGYVKSHRMKY